MNPVDTKLKEAMQKIEDIAREYDCAASVVLCSGEKSEYLNFLFGNEGKGPSWSCVYLDGNGIRIKAKGRRDHKERYKINLTVKAVATMLDVHAMQFAGLEKVMGVFKEKFNIKEGDRFHQPGR